MTKEVTCIVCPKSCKIKIDKNYNVLNNNNCCARGKKYAISELVDPRRIFTSTARVTGGELDRVPVRTSKPIKKKEWTDAIKLVNELKLQAPVKFRKILVKDFLEKGINLISTRDIKKRGR